MFPIMNRSLHFFRGHFWPYSHFHVYNSYSKNRFLFICSKRSQQHSSDFYIESLGLKKQFKSILKNETFVKRSFFGELDPDYTM